MSVAAAAARRAVQVMVLCAVTFAASGRSCQDVQLHPPACHIEQPVQQLLDTTGLACRAPAWQLLASHPCASGTRTLPTQHQPPQSGAVLQAWLQCGGRLGLLLHCASPCRRVGARQGPSTALLHASCRAEPQSPPQTCQHNPTPWHAPCPTEPWSFLQLGQREFKAARAGRGGSYAAARTFMRVAATILTTEALRRSTSSSSEAAPQLPSHGAGPGTFAGPLSALTIPLGSLRRGGSACQKLAEHLAEWGHMELSNGCDLGF